MYSESSSECEQSRCRAGLTADLQVHVLVVLTYGVAGGAEIPAGVCELNIFQGERGDPRMAAYHNIPIDALWKTKTKQIIQRRRFY